MRERLCGVTAGTSRMLVAWGCWRAKNLRGASSVYANGFPEALRKQNTSGGAGNGDDAMMVRWIA